MSAYKRENGHWYYRTRVKRPDGRVARINGRPKTNTKKAALHAEALAVEEILNPEFAKQRKEHAIAKGTPCPTLNEYSDIYLAATSAKHKPSAVKAKRQILTAYIKPRLGPMRLDAIRQVDVDLFMSDLLTGAPKKKGLARKTVNNIASVLASLLRYAHRNKVIDAIALEFFVKTEPNELSALSDRNLAALLGTCDDPRYRVAILLASDAGMRVGELRAVRWSDVDESAPSIRIAQAYDTDGNLGAPKSWRARIVPLSTRLWSAIRSLMPSDKLEWTGSGTILTKLKSDAPLSYWAVRDKLVDIYKAAGITRPRMPWHCLRHSFCTRLASSGASIHIIKEMAGHKSIETTLRYMHTTEDEKRAAIDRVFGQ
jgi:integrase